MTQIDHPSAHQHDLGANPSLSENKRTLTTDKVVWSLIILATLYFCYFHNLGVLGLVGPDEPRYAWIARDMAESGDWVTPRLYGRPWFEKPPLYYWGAAVCFKFLGVNETAARLPSAFSALLATIMIAWLGWRTYGAETARWVLLLLPTTVAMVGFSHAAATDMPFAAMLTGAMACVAIVVGLWRRSDRVNAPKTASMALFLFGFFLGLATLAKGPAALVLAGGPLLAWSAVTKRWRDALRCLHPVAILAFCLTALPWYIVCARRNPEFLRVFLIEHNILRYLTPEFQHVRPFWYYVPILLTAFVPWTLALCWSTVFGSLQSWPLHRRVSHGTLLLLCWAVFCALFFSASKSKLPGYILPAVPAIGLLFARCYTHLEAHREKTFRRLLWAGIFVSVPAALVILWIGAHPIASSHTTAQAARSIGWVLFLLALANACLTFRGEQTRLAAGIEPLCVMPVLMILTFFPTLSAPWLRYDPSGRSIARDLAGTQLPTEPIYAAGSMRRGQQYSLSFYLHHEVKSWDPIHAQEGYLIVRGRTCDGIVQYPWTCAAEPIELKTSGWFVYEVKRAEGSAAENQWPEETTVAVAAEGAVK